MAKRSRPPAKGEAQAPGEEETTAPAPGVPAPREGIVEFYYLFGAIAVLTAIAMILYLLNLYVM